MSSVYLSQYLLFYYSAGCGNIAIFWYFCIGVAKMGPKVYKALKALKAPQF